MANSMSEHSRELRRAAAKERRKSLRSLAAVLLDKKESAELEALRAWYGSAHDPATLNDTIKTLIHDAYRKLPASAKGLDQIDIPLTT